jgi:hypothetical protein
MPSRLRRAPCAALGATLVLLVCTASALEGQRTISRTAPASVTISVQYRDEPGGPMAIVKRAFVCVGDSTDTKRYGVKQMLNDAGEIVFSVPYGASILVTAYNEEGGRNRYTIGSRVATTVRSRSQRVPVIWNGWERGMTCDRPVLSKSLPGGDEAPRLRATLRTLPQTLSRTRDIEILTTTRSGTAYLEVGGIPRQFRISQRSDFAGAAWQDARVLPSPTGENLMRAIPFELAGGDGRKTIYVQLRNDAGVSPASQVVVNYVDLYTCRLRYQRAPNALERLTMAEETLAVVRGQSKTLDVAWPSANEGKPGYGMHLRWAKNAADHPIELTVGGGLVWNKVTLDRNESRSFKADLRAVRCP